MRALVVYCHPRGESFTAAVRDVVMRKLAEAGAEVRLRDLYAEGFQPVLTASEHEGYLDTPKNREPVERDCRDLEWCDTLIFVYPTWWYGLPAMLKGWLDRVFLPDLAFTTCGASWWLTTLVGAPGRRTLMSGVGILLKPGARKVFAAHYLMDSSTDDSRAAHLRKVAERMDRLTGPAPRLALRPLRTEAAE